MNDIQQHETPVGDSNSIIDVIGVNKNYRIGNTDVPILQNINITIKDGEFLAIMGPSGSGKSTIMNLVGCLDRPTDGRIIIMGKDINKISDNELAILRGCKSGFIFQKFNLISRLTALQNVGLPTHVKYKNSINPRIHAIELLELVGLNDRMDHKPTELSGGQCQRVAITRSLINNPSLILADEPTGDPDSKIENN